jgi:hypothetical protein
MIFVGDFKKAENSTMIGIVPHKEKENGKSL